MKNASTAPNRYVRKSETLCMALIACLIATILSGFSCTANAGIPASEHDALVDLHINTPEASSAAPYIPRYDHVVIVIMSAQSNIDILNNVNAQYINGTLIAGGASFNQSYALSDAAHPNYLGLFSGSTQGVADDICPKSFTGTNNLRQQLINAGFSFVQYSEDLPPDSTTCASGLYTRTHNPVPDFLVEPTLTVVSRPYTEFATALGSSTLPTISFVVPNLCHDMHGSIPSCSTSQLITLGDQWLQNNLPQYLNSSSAQNGLLIVTWDHGRGSTGYATDPIPTIFFGPHVRAGLVSSKVINHYSVLRTLEDMYGLPSLGNAATAVPITEIWDPIFKNGFE